MVCCSAGPLLAIMWGATTKARCRVFFFQVGLGGASETLETLALALIPFDSCSVDSGCSLSQTKLVVNHP